VELGPGRGTEMERKRKKERKSKGRQDLSFSSSGTIIVCNQIFRYDSEIVTITSAIYIKRNISVLGFQNVFPPAVCALKVCLKKIKM
jgi:hypothetical protein